MPFVERGRCPLSTLHLCKRPSFGVEGSCRAVRPSSRVSGIKDGECRRFIGRNAFARPKVLPEIESNVYAFRAALAPPIHGISGVQEIGSGLKL